MAGDEEERVADREAEACRKGRRLDEAMSGEGPDKVETFNRRADAKRERYSRDSFEESVTEEETERKHGPG